MVGDRPKALAPVAGRPFLAWQVGWLARQGVTRIHLAAGYRADQLRAWASEPPPGCTITCSQEPEPLGTAGGLRFAAAALSDPTLLVVNGDTLLPNLKLPDLLAAHARAGAPVTMAITRIEASGRYGTVEADNRDRVTAFLEKAERTGGWVNGGVYAVQRGARDRIPEGRASSLETDLFPALAAAGGLLAHRAAPPLLDMGTPEGLAALEEYLSAHPDFSNDWKFR